MSRNEECNKANEQLPIDGRGRSSNLLVNSGLLMCTFDKKSTCLTEEEIYEYRELIELEKVLDKELSNLRNEEKNFPSTKEIMDLLHKYNDIRDTTQTLMGVIAVTNRTAVKNLYQHYGLSMEEE